MFYLTGCIMRIHMEKIHILLSNIRSAHNVGAIFRTADGAGVAKIHLGGYTPAPIDRYGRVVDEIQKTSLGATDTVQWEEATDEKSLIETLKSEGFHIVAVEQNERAIVYTEHQITKPTLFIFGNEIDGVSNGLISLSDEVIQIPMHGKKESLNVSTTAGIVLFNARIKYIS